MGKHKSGQAKVNVVCETCGVTFQKRIAEKTRTKHNYCSRMCVPKHGKKRDPENYVELVCSGCGKSFIRRKTYLSRSKSGFYFCSRKCKDDAQRIGSGFEIMLPEHYGIMQEKYRDKALAHYPNRCELCGWDEHVVCLDVHHIDEDRDNNSIDNLVILCCNCHQYLHRTGKKYSRIPLTISNNDAIIIG